MTCRPNLCNLCDLWTVQDFLVRSHNAGSVKSPAVWTNSHNDQIVRLGEDCAHPLCDVFGRGVFELFVNIWRLFCIDAIKQKLQLNIGGCINVATIVFYSGGDIGPQITKVAQIRRCAVGFVNLL